VRAEAEGQQHGSGLAAQVRTYAREAWLPRAAAWPCRARGTGIPGPRHDAVAVGRRRLQGAEAARRVPAQEDGAAAGREMGRLWFLQRVPRLSRQQWGKKKGRRPWCSPVGLKGDRLDAVAGHCRRIGAVQGERRRRGRRTGRRPGEAPGHRPSPPCAAPAPPPPLLLFVWRRRKGGWGF
jgi:hypothetical protein